MRVELEFSAMPDWVKEQSAIHVGKNKRPICYVEAVKRTAKVSGTWHDNARQVIVGRNMSGDTVALHGGYYDSIINFTREQLAGYMGGKIDLPIDGAILQISLYYKLNTITMYVRSDGPYMSLLSGLSDGAQLSPVQANVLRHIAGLNSSGRKRERTQYHFPVELVIVVARELETMGLCKVNKAHAITVKPSSLALLIATETTLSLNERVGKFTASFFM